MRPDKDHLASGYLTHELRAPLTSIRCGLEIFMAGHPDLSEGDRKLLTIALKNVSKLNLLINDIMDLSKIQAGRMPLFPAPADPADLIRETADEMESWVRNSGLELRVSAPGACPPVLADRRRTSQALTNLVSNAIKFTPKGGSITITAEEGTGRDAGFAVFSVKDTGCGISPEDQRKVFGYFVQVGTPEKRAEGTGLGLALARSMIELQGGLMWLVSKPGEGSTFKFTLPIHKPA